jgi:hypothetical protein
MESWRYDPATFDDRPLEIKMMLAFHYFQPAPPGSGTVSLPGGKEVPPAHLEELREEKLKFASTLLAGSTFSETEGNGWLLRTNVRKSDMRTVVEALEQATAAFDVVFPEAPPLPDSSRVIVLLFRETEHYNRVAAFDNIRNMRAAMTGKYHPDEQIAYASTGDMPLEVVSRVLVHEAVHHLVHQRLFGDDREPPVWADEGIATFISTLRDPGKGALDLARFNREKKIEKGYLWPAQGVHYLKALDTYDRREMLPDLGLFLSGEVRVEFDVFYGQTWVLVHYLINADEGKYRGPFRKWLLGKIGELGSVTGKTTSQLQDALGEYRKNLKRAR